MHGSLRWKRRLALGPKEFASEVEMESCLEGPVAGVWRAAAGPGLPIGAFLEAPLGAKPVVPLLLPERPRGRTSTALSLWPLHMEGTVKVEAEVRTSI